MSSTPIEQIARDAASKIHEECLTGSDVAYHQPLAAKIITEALRQACGQQPAAPITLEFSNLLGRLEREMVKAQYFIVHGHGCEAPELEKAIQDLSDYRKQIAAPTPPVQQPPTEAEPDWWWCDIDPDESGNSAYEAMYQHRPRFEPVRLQSSYHGPTKYGVMVPSLEDDGEEAFTFDTEEEAKKFIEQRKAAPHPVRGGEQ